MQTFDLNLNVKNYQIYHLSQETLELCQMKHNAKLTEIKRCFKSRTLKKMYLLNGKISYNSQTRFILLRTVLTVLNYAEYYLYYKKKISRTKTKIKNVFLDMLGEKGLLGKSYITRLLCSISCKYICTSFSQIIHRKFVSYPLFNQGNLCLIKVTSIQIFKLY